MLARLTALIALALCFASSAQAQNSWTTPGGSNATGYVQMWLNGLGLAVPASSATPEPITCISGCASPTAPTIAATSTGQLPVTSTSARILLGDGTGSFPNLIVTNKGSQDVAVKTGNGSVSCTSFTDTTCTPIPAGYTVEIPQAGGIDLAAITASGSSTLNIIQSSGPMQIAGGGGSSGGGGAITAAASSYSAGAFVAGAGVDGWDATQGSKADAAWTSGSGSTIALLKAIAGSAASTSTNTGAAIPAGTNSIGSVNLAVNVTLTDCSGTVAAGGTANNAFSAQTALHGFTILNDDTTEPLWISFTTTAAASTAGSYPLAPATATTFAGASSFTSPPGMGTNHALSVVATTTGHKFSCTWW